MARRRTFAALLSVLAVGCGTFIDPPGNRCTSDADCASETRCDVDEGMCVAEPRTAYRVGFEVLAASDPYGGTPTAISFPPIALEGQTVHDLPIRGSIPVRGLVHWRLDPVTANVTFALLSEFPGGPTTHVETQSSAEPVASDGRRANYATRLVPSRIYEVRVEPNGDWLSELPPIRLRFESTVAGTRIDEDLPYPDTLTEIEGVIVDADGIEQPGMIVRAEDMSGAAVSSTYTTGSDAEVSPGHFLLRMVPGVERWLFTIHASNDRIQMGGLSPEFTVDPGASFPGEAVTIVVPPVSDQVIVYQGTVEAASSPGRGQPATLAFVSNDVVDDTTGVIGSFRTMTTTAEDGTFEVSLLPGTYDVLITPSNPTLGIQHEQNVRIDPTTTQLRGQIFAVPNRLLYGGWAQTADATRMFDARIRSHARGSTYEDMLAPVAIYARSNETRTDFEGFFSLPLDVGLYDVVVEPPLGSNWPWEIQRDVPIGASTTISNVLQVGAPVPISGTVYYEELSRLPASMALVRAFAILDDGEGSTRTVQIGETTADADGNFTLLLPADP
jgi:hypothetical protein